MNTPMRTADITTKIETFRRAKAYGRIKLNPATVKRIREGTVPKGNLVEATKLTGIWGAKKTGELLPFCHPIPVDFVSVEVKVGERQVEVLSEVRGIARTGYEMEALTAVSTALLNVYDMCKALDKDMVIEEIKLLEKGGGKSDWAKDMEGVVVKVFSPNKEIQHLIEEHITRLGAKLGDEPQIILTTEGSEILRELKGIERVISLYDFRRHTTAVKEDIKVGIDDDGRLVVELPRDKERIEFFFSTFGGLLRGLI